MLKPEQIKSLDVLNARIMNEGYQPNETDTKNLNYGISKGWKENNVATTAPAPVAPAPALPEFASKSNTVYSSDNINDNIKATGSQIAQTESQVFGNIDYGAEVEKLLSQAKEINNLTSSEVADIQNYGNQIGGQYDAEIAKAEREKTAGMGKSTIGGGRMGGFMNTQITGAGAINAGVQDWAGAGGKLESIKSAYDANISDLQNKKASAVALAKQAREEYIRTGKSTALEAVQKALSAAQSLNAQILQNENTKADMLIKASTEARTKQDYDKGQAETSITNMAQAGLEASAIPQETKTKYESLMGLPEGTFDKFYDDIKLATQFAQEGRYADFTQKLTNILSQVPAGQTISINGKSYQGFGTKSTSAESDLDKLLTPSEASSLGVPYGTTKGQAAEQGLIPKEKLTGKEKIDMEVKLAGSFEQYAKESKASVKQLGIMETAWNEIQDGMKTGYITNPATGKQEKFNLNAPSQAMLVTFQKLLDPTSVVRESEYARSGDGQALVQRIQGMYDKLTRGGAGVTVQDLSQFYTLSQELLKNYQKEQLNLAHRIQTQANNYGLNIENILTPDVLDLLDKSGSTTTVKDEGGDYSW